MKYMQLLLTITQRLSPTSHAHFHTNQPVVTWIFVLYSYNLNRIMMECMQNWGDAEIKWVFEKYYARLEKVGVKSTINIMDDECSAEIMSFVTRTKTDHQLAPPWCHRENDVERVIQIGKYHIISGMMTTDSSYPIKDWDRLKKQDGHSLNMLHPSFVNPKCLAATWLEG